VIAHVADAKRRVRQLGLTATKLVALLAHPLEH
jgi:hypothetical protein